MDLSAILGPVVESLLVPVKKHLGYLLSSTKHVRDMSTRMKKLHDTSVDVKKHMETNNISNLETPTGVPDWLEEVKKIKEDAERISSNINAERRLRLEGLCNNTKDVIHLPQLLELDLRELPNFTSIYPAGGEYKSAGGATSSSSGCGIIDKPFFNKQAMIPPRLELLNIFGMEALKSIWAAPACGSSDAPCSLRQITVIGCANLVNMFPRNPMPFLHHLEAIGVYECGAMEVLFEIDNDDDDEDGCIIGDHEIKYEASTSNLRSIKVTYSDKFSEVWRLKGGGDVNMNHPHHLILLCRCFEAVEQIIIVGCESFRSVYTPTTARFDLRALKKVLINGTDHDLERYRQVEISK